MTKLRIQDAFPRLILSAAVAVFCTVMLVGSPREAKHSVTATQPNGTVILMADGGDPVPPPVPLPWLGVTA
jgi:hypothetical protein